MNSDYWTIIYTFSRKEERRNIHLLNKSICKHVSTFVDVKGVLINTCFDNVLPDEKLKKGKKRLVLNQEKFNAHAEFLIWRFTYEHLFSEMKILNKLVIEFNKISFPKMKYNKYAGFVIDDKEGNNRVCDFLEACGNSVISYRYLEYPFCY